ncbi:phosphoinositide phosphatase family protein [Actinidia rufa]|uniref:Phosphoinositide phosphatase family protein n=1 Tax=Actinidia rufa TaxID=165716 RepID=A0A7J0FIS3_9ERIC|nr:phosphoinositide phosphatase family protein [Actinidia rufa]
MAVGGYLKRGVNEKGRVANDVETEQIVFEDVPEGCPIPISSVVQNRGSIPLFWSQETSRLNLKPDIILSRKDQKYEATRLHFENLAKRYGNPIIILNLIKTHERKPRESILRAEFANAIEFINNDLLEENRLKFLHWDLHKHSRRNVDAGDQSPTRDCNVAIEKNGDSDGATNFEMKLCGGNSMANGNHSINPSMFQKGVLRTNCIDCLDRTNVAQYAYGLVSLGKQLRTLGVMDTSKIDLDDPLADELMWFYERMGDTLAHQYGGSAAHNKALLIVFDIRSSRRWSLIASTIAEALLTQWLAHLASPKLPQLQTCTLMLYRLPRYSLSEGVNGKLQLNPRNSLELFNGTIAMPTWMQRNKMRSIYSWDIFNHKRVNLSSGSWILTSITVDGGMGKQRWMKMEAELANCIVGNYCGLYFRSFFKRSLSDGNILRESSSPMSNTNIKQDLSSCALLR